MLCGFIAVFMEDLKTVQQSQPMLSGRRQPYYATMGYCRAEIIWSVMSAHHEEFR